MQGSYFRHAYHAQARFSCSSSAWQDVGLRHFRHLQVSPRANFLCRPTIPFIHLHPKTLRCHQNQTVYRHILDSINSVTELLPTITRPSLRQQTQGGRVGRSSRQVLPVRKGKVRFTVALIGKLSGKANKSTGCQSMK
jgi:hypothetical protein